MNRNTLRQKTDLLRLLAHPTRLALMTNLLDGPMCVTDIHELLGVKQANASQHLAALRQARLILYHEDGKTRCYYLARPHLVRQLMEFLNEEFPVIELSPEEVRHAARLREEAKVSRVKVPVSNSS